MTDLRDLLRDSRHKIGRRATISPSGLEGRPREEITAAGGPQAGARAKTKQRAKQQNSPASGHPKQTKPPLSAASLKGRSTLALFELARNAAESRVQIGAEGIDHDDDSSGDTRCDQAIFDRRRTRFIPAESNKQFTHVRPPALLVTRALVVHRYIATW